MLNIRSYGLERSQLGCTIMKLGQMVLKGVNRVHNNKHIGDTFLGKWSFISLRNPWVSVFDVVLLKVELEMWFLQFLNLNLPENRNFHQKPQFLEQNLQFSSKSTVFIKICGFQKMWFFIKICGFHQICSFHQNLWFSSKSVFFIKICDFHQNPQFLVFLSELSRGQHQDSM